MPTENASPDIRSVNAQLACYAQDPVAGRSTVPFRVDIWLTVENQLG